MRALLGELTQDVVEQVNLRNVHNMEKFTQSGNVHYDNMAKQLSVLNDLMSKLVGQVCQPTVGSHFQTRAIVGHASPHNSSGLNPGPGLETFFGLSTSNQGVMERQI